MSIGVAFAFVWLKPPSRPDLALLRNHDGCRKAFARTNSETVALVHSNATALPRVTNGFLTYASGPYNSQTVIRAKSSSSV